jgi:hypothetical protein
MRILALGLVLAASAGAAAAGDLSEARDYGATDYSAQVYYRLDFGGHQAQAQSLGLRFDNQRAAAAGAPAMLQARLGEQGLAQFSVNGLDLRGAMLSSNESSGGGFWSSLTVGQWIALGFSALVFGQVVSDAVKTDEEPVISGTGGG